MEKGIGLTGTIRANRKFLPPDFKKKNPHYEKD
jgi:hypothetical protein